MMSPMKFLICVLFFVSGFEALAQPGYGPPPGAYPYGQPPRERDYSSYQSAGCGLGSLVFKDEGFSQVFAATTNGSFGSQTFGISSGTSNCRGAGGYASVDAQKQMYVQTNRDVITQEMAQGSGEHLVALATLMGCEKNSSPKFAMVMKHNYKVITAGKSTEQMLGNIKTAISSDPSLAHSCNSLIVKN